LKNGVAVGFFCHLAELMRHADAMLPKIAYTIFLRAIFGNVDLSTPRLCPFLVFDPR
jgi:hypothetical protein